MALAFWSVLLMTVIMSRCAAGDGDHPTRDLVVVAAWLLTAAAALVWTFITALAH